MENRPARRGVVTPVRALTLCIAWIAVGLFLRFRFRIVGCDQVEGGWPLAVYFFVSAALVIYANLRDGAVAEEDELVLRYMSRLAGLVVLVITLSACLPYGSDQSACSS